MSTATVTRLPKSLRVSLSDIEHGYHITATAQASWDPVGETGGPLTLAFWANSLVMYTPSGSGNNHNLRFFLRGVAYNVRADYERQTDGAWELNAGHIDRADWTTVREMQASDAARRDIRAILAEVGRQIVESRPDLFLDAAVTQARRELDSATSRVDTLAAELVEARKARLDADTALQAAIAARSE